MSKIAVQMIFGQNPEPFLEAAIKSVSWADYFVGCNTAPKTDIGEENAEKFCYATGHTDAWFLADLYPDENGHFSFADARNKTLEDVIDGDYVLIVDADDVHYPEFEDIVRTAIAEGVDSLTAHFFHLMVYKDLYQYVQPREILYKKYPTTQWVEGVHEKLLTPRQWPRTVPYHYMHYGYIKPQSEVFNRWKFYSDLVGDYNHYEGQNPNHILDDRISVSKTLEVNHPLVAQDILKNYPRYKEHKPNMESVPVEKVGLIMIAKEDDADFLAKNLSSLYNTVRYPNFEVLYITESNREITEIFNCKAPEDQVVMMDNSTSLTEALNFGLNAFRVRHDIQYIGWVHPDMVFQDPNWLRNLWQELQDYPKIGKICAANTRDQLPTSLIEGHEQCYIIRKDIVNKVGLFDENYVGIGGYEDWDYNRRLMNHNDYKVMTTPKAKVYHEGMGTRAKRDTTRDQIHNANYYKEKWNTDAAPV